MKRRNFLRNSLLAGTATAMTGTTLAAQPSQKPEQAFKMLFGTHDGMFENNAGKNFIDQIKWAYDQGFRAIEDNGMMSRTPEEQSKIGDTLAKLGMKMGVFVITSDSWHWKISLTTGKQEFKDKMIVDCKKALEVAKRCNATHATVVPGNYERTLSFDMQTANVIDALKRGAEILEPGKLVMVLEPLSDNPDLFLRHSDQTYMICKAVNSPSCKILFDMYHMQRNEGNIMANMDRVWDEIGYFQIGDNPGRKEPTTGEMNYKNIFKHINDKGYKGILGMEHGISKPGKEGELALIKAYREVDLA
ncbi:MAG TPA: TIM barrel protein [Chitinophagaceae bacterium]|nr:TIM barrel protein [Chitinophagaceae bacterium]